MNHSSSAFAGLSRDPDATGDRVGMWLEELRVIAVGIRTHEGKGASGQNFSYRAMGFEKGRIGVGTGSRVRVCN